jgi:nitrite reductase (NADH) small subunit
VSGWHRVCPLSRLPVDRGVAALLDGEQVALFRLTDGSLHALDNLDPFSGAMVLSRGMVGSRGERSTVASPMYKQAFDLATGRCLDDGAVSVGTHLVRVSSDGVVEVQRRGARRVAS